MDKLAQLKQGLAFEESDSGESDTEAKQDVDEKSHARLLDAISTMDGSKRLTHTLRGVHGQSMSESGLASQDVQANTLMSDLMGSLQQSASYGVIKKQLKSTFNSGGVVETPAPKHVKEKVQRMVGYEKAVKDISRWDPVVTANRKAPQMKFPLQQADTKMLNTHTRYRPVTALDKEMHALLAKVKPENKIHKGKVFTPAEERQMAAMSLEEATERRAELLRMRAIMYTKNSKLRWQNKIKSKRYRRALKKEKEKKAEKELEELAVTDPQALADKMEESEKKRILERGRLRHAGGRKFAREAKIFAKYDDEKRQQIQDMIEKHRALTKKDAVVMSSSESEGEVEEPLAKQWVQPTLWRQAPASTDLALNASSRETDTTASATNRETDTTISTQKTDIDEERGPGLPALDMEEEVPQDNKANNVEADIEEAPQVNIANNIEADIEEKTPQVHMAKNVEDEAQEVAREDDESPNEPSTSTKQKPEKNVHAKNNSQKDAKGHKLQDPGSEFRQKKKRDRKKKQKNKNRDTGSQPHHSKESNTESTQEQKVDDQDKMKEVLMTIEEAFDDDDVVADFIEEKRQTIEEEAEKDVSTFLPGWGRWAGAGIKQPTKLKQRFIKKAKQQPREDNNIGHVVISKKKNTAIEQHKAEKLPYMFKSTGHMKRILSTPLGKDNIKPKTVVSRIGHIIHPIQESVLLQQAQKRKAVDTDIDISASEKPKSKSSKRRRR